MSQRLNSDAEQIMEWILLLKIKKESIPYYSEFQVFYSMIKKEI